MTERTRVTASLLTIARRALTGEAALAKGSVLLVAVSGGPDSMALLHVAARLGPRLGVELRAHGVDHGLRTEAARELDAAEAFSRALGVPFARTLVRIARGGNLQARARTERYAALAEAARAAGAKAIATAHHADDRAETVLLRLLRGSGPHGLAVLPARAPLGETGLELVRPLLRARRSAIIAHVERHAIPSASDHSNRDPRYLRTRVRTEVLPLLAELSPGSSTTWWRLRISSARRTRGRPRISAPPVHAECAHRAHAVALEHGPSLASRRPRGDRRSQSTTAKLAKSASKGARST